MTITVINRAAINARPTAIGSNSVTTEYEQVHTFSVSEFTTSTTPPYSDPEGDPASYIKVKSLPVTGILELNQSAVSVGDIVPVGDISSGNFVYDPDDLIETENSVSFNFDVADNGSNTLSGLNTGVMTIVTNAKKNEKPSQVGDNSISINSLSTYTFTTADFTTNTTPVYSDPEGDDAYKLKITTIPSQGTLTHNNQNVVLNQEILFTEIASGLFVYSAPNLTLATVFTFDFEISDVGSKQFTS